MGQLQDARVTVHLFGCTVTHAPDFVVPYNWFSTHAGGHVEHTMQRNAGFGKLRLTIGLDVPIIELAGGLVRCMLAGMRTER